MRTTLTIDDSLLAEAKLIAARTHRALGSVLEDALRELFADHSTVRTGELVLPEFPIIEPGLLAGVGLYDTQQIAELLGDNAARTAS